MTADFAELEQLTQAYGRDLFARLEEDRPMLFSRRWLDDRLMSWSMDEEAVKVQMFRFIDVLPMLQTTPQVTQHLREYFEEADGRLPRWMRWGLRWMPEGGVVGGLVARAARYNARRMASRFIAGSNVEEALDAIARQRRQAMGFTIDLLGEAVLTEAEADAYQQHYFDLIEGLSAEVNHWPEVPLIDRDHAGPMPRVNVSIKLSSLYSQFDPIDPEGTSTAVKYRLRPILELARRRGVFVNIDMEQFAYKDVTLRIFREILSEPDFAGWSDVGLAVQAYLRSCGDDLQQLAVWAERRKAPVWVRLVKGAYWDYESAVAAQNGWPLPVFAEKWQTDANFEQQSRFLIENWRLLRPAMGSHNVRSIAHALSLAECFRLPDRCLEFQMLYGMADPIKAALVKMGQRVRVYTPYGQLLPGMAYLVRRLLENTANQSFLRASFIERVSEEELLMNPTRATFDDVRTENGHKLASVDHAGGSGMEYVGKPAAGNAFANEPLADFSREAEQTRMREALRMVASQLGGHEPLIIRGKRIDTAERLTSNNPSHYRQVVGTCARATAAHAEMAVQAAAAAFDRWRAEPASRRAECLRRAAALMRRRRFELAALEVFECAKQWREADADVAEAIDFCEYYALEVERLAQVRTRNIPGEDNAYFYEPRGVAVVIAPWNFPLAILCGMTAAALGAGCPAIMKPAEQSPIIAARLQEIWLEAGIPPEVVHYLPGVGEEIGPTLVNHPDVAVIVFTGSRGVGLAINRDAAVASTRLNHVKRVIAEMGGKNAIIVDDDADLDEATHGIITSAFGYQGQKCSACSRAILLAPIYDALLGRLIDAARSIRVGPAEEPGFLVGPVIDDEARRRILGYIDKGKAESRLVYAADVGGLADEGYYVGPHVFADVPPRAIIAQEEIFGPVLAVMKAGNLDEALAIANGTDYALTGGLFSRSPAHIEKVKRLFRVGNLYINRKITGALVDRQPFGGFKLSGIGSKAGGPDYLVQFLLPRCITENTMRHGFVPGIENLPQR